MSFIAAAVIGGAVVGAGASVYAGKKASKAQQSAAELGAEAQLRATELGIEEQRRQFDIAQDQYKLMSEEEKWRYNLQQQQFKDALAEEKRRFQLAQDQRSEALAKEQERFDLGQQAIQPFVTAGQEALGGFTPYQEVGQQAFQQQKNLLGLGGADAQQSAISAIADSPRMAELTRQGENALLQNASATGGLRGGNLQSALAQFRPQLLNQLIEEQYAKLGGLATGGLDATRNLAALGQSSASGVGVGGNMGTSAPSYVSPPGTATPGAGAFISPPQQGSAVSDLISRQGDIQAQQYGITGAAQAGQHMNVGQSVSNLFQSIPQALLMTKFMTTNKPPV